MRSLPSHPSSSFRSYITDLHVRGRSSRSLLAVTKRLLRFAWRECNRCFLLPTYPSLIHTTRRPSAPPDFARRPTLGGRDVIVTFANSRERTRVTAVVNGEVFGRSFTVKWRKHGGRTGGSASRRPASPNKRPDVSVRDPLSSLRFPGATGGRQNGITQHRGEYAATGRVGLR